jgi:hypothetical protein
VCYHQCALQLSQQQQTKECTLHITKILPQRHLTGNQATEKYYNVLITDADIFKQTNKQKNMHSHNRKLNTSFTIKLWNSQQKLWRLCGKITFVKETSSYTVREFHTFWIVSEKKKNVGHYFLSNPPILECQIQNIFKSCSCFHILCS